MASIGRIEVRTFRKCHPNLTFDLLCCQDCLVHPTGVCNRTSVFTTPWFELVGKSVGEESLPHYSISTRDYVSVLATTQENALVLVRQFRPAVEMISLEL